MCKDDASIKLIFKRHNSLLVAEVRIVIALEAGRGDLGEPRGAWGQRHRVWPRGLNPPSCRRETCAVCVACASVVKQKEGTLEKASRAKKKDGK